MHVNYTGRALPVVELLGDDHPDDEELTHGHTASGRFWSLGLSQNDAECFVFVEINNRRFAITVEALLGVAQSVAANFPRSAQG